jgi:hypothetical protein
MILVNNFHRASRDGLWEAVNIALQFQFCSKCASYFHRLH